MKKFLYILLSVLVLVFIIARISNSQEIPKISSYVVDNANILNQETKDKIINLSKTLNEKDGTELVVVTIPSLNGTSLEEYSMKIAHETGIGKKGKDNGVLFLIIKNDRKMRIEVGYGLEGKLTDITSKHILDDVKPFFKKGDYDGGILKGVEEIIQVVNGEFKAESKGMSDGMFWFIIIVLAVILALIIFTGGDILFIPLMIFDGSSGSSSGSSFGGGGFGGGGSSGDW